MNEIVKVCEKHGNLKIEQTIKRGKCKNGFQMFRCKVCYTIIKNKYLSMLENQENDRKHKKNYRLEKYDLKIRWDSIKKKFNLSKEQYLLMLDEQNNLCAICKNPEKIQSRIGRGRSEFLCVDHCHLTNKVRKLLCRKCNSALGGFNDSIVLLEAALNYLKQF